MLIAGIVLAAIGGVLVASTVASSLMRDAGRLWADPEPVPRAPMVAGIVVMVMGAAVCAKALGWW